MTVEQITTELSKAPTGISGLDEITGGGLPAGRTTLVCGSAGCGKTLMAMEFLVRGATEFDEPGVFMAFEETESELTQNVRSLGFDLDVLVEQKRVLLDFVRVERSEMEENGEYDLEGLFVRLGYAIDSIDAKRVVLDTIETLFGGFGNESILRAELRRLFRWLKDRGVTAIVTGERGDGTLTRQGLEEYVSDCVILLDHRVIDQISTRRLRVVKYRGSVHGTNEYPFLIDQHGFSVLPLSSLGLSHIARTERISSGIEQLDEMLSGQGFYEGSTILVSGTSGSGKTSVAASFIDAACRRGQRALHFAFEESPSQVIRNMKSIGIDLQRWQDAGLLQIQAVRPSIYGLEMHLVNFHRLISDFQPGVVIIDPISSMMHVGSNLDASAMVTRLIDFLKSEGVTSMLTSLTAGNSALEQTSLEVSSLVDSWLLLRDVENAGERNRVMYLLKSRGMAHSNRMREFLLTNNGVQLRDVRVGPSGAMTGSMRGIQQANERAEALFVEQQMEEKRRHLERQRELMEAKIAVLRTEFEAEQDVTLRLISQQQNRRDLLQKQTATMVEDRRLQGYDLDRDMSSDSPTAVERP